MTSASSKGPGVNRDGKRCWELPTMTWVSDSASSFLLGNLGATTTSPQTSFLFGSHLPAEGLGRTFKAGILRQNTYQGWTQRVFWSP